MSSCVCVACRQAGTMSTCVDASITCSLDVDDNLYVHVHICSIMLVVLRALGCWAGTIRISITIIILHFESMRGFEATNNEAYLTSGQVRKVE